MRALHRRFQAYHMAAAGTSISVALPELCSHGAALDKLDPLLMTIPSAAAAAKFARIRPLIIRLL